VKRRPTGLPGNLFRRPKILHLGKMGLRLQP